MAFDVSRMACPLLRGGSALPARSTIVLPVKTGNANNALRQGLPKITGDAHPNSGKGILLPKPLGVAAARKNASRILPPLPSNDHTDDKLPLIDNVDQHTDVFDGPNQNTYQFEEMPDSPSDQRDPIGLPSLGNRKPAAKPPPPIQSHLVPLH
jgi:hypothetical protein